jgi:hypothetical protein
MRTTNDSISEKEVTSAFHDRRWIVRAIGSCHKRFRKLQTQPKPVSFSEDLVNVQIFSPTQLSVSVVPDKLAQNKMGSRAQVWQKHKGEGDLCGQHEQEPYI